MTNYSTDYINLLLNAWHAYVKTKGFDEARRWAKKDEQLDQSLYEMFTAGWHAALAQPADNPYGYDWSMLEAAHESLREHMARIKELKAQLAQKDQEPVQREWVGLTEKDFSAINQSCLTKLQAATSAESILKEKNS